MACSDNATSVNAEKMTLQEFVKMPGFTWFNYEFNNYQPDDFIVKEIQKKYNSSEHSFVIFAKPSCSCPGKHIQTSEFYKTLEKAQIPFDKCELFSVTSINNEHPYKSTISLHELPTIIILKNGNPIFSVSDTLNITNSTNKNNDMKIEESLLIGLQK